MHAKYNVSVFESQTESNQLLFKVKIEKNKN